MKDNKTEFVAFRLTPAERRKLASASASANMTESAYLRALISKPAIRLVQISVDGARLDAVMHELKKSGTNLNQIAYRLNRGGGLEAKELSSTLDEHRAAAERLSAFIDDTRPKCL